MAAGVAMDVEAEGDEALVVVEAVGVRRGLQAADPSVGFLLRAWSVPGLADLGLMAVSGLTFAVAFYGVSQACRLTRASNVAPFEYAAVPLGAVAGYLVWQEVPDLPAVLGAALVVGSGLYVFHRKALCGHRLTLRRTVGVRPRLYEGASG